MSRSADTFFRAGYAASLDAWKLYLADDHDIHFRASYDQAGCSDEDEDQDEKEQQTGRPPVSEEERRRKEKTQAMFDFISDARQAFQSLYRRAPRGSGVKNAACPFTRLYSYHQVTARREVLRVGRVHSTQRTRGCCTPNERLHPLAVDGVVDGRWSLGRTTPDEKRGGSD